MPEGLRPDDGARGLRRHRHPGPLTLRVLAALGYAHVTVVGRRAEALTPLQEFAGGLGMEIGVTQSREALRGARAIVTGLPRWRR